MVEVEVLVDGERREGGGVVQDEEGAGLELGVEPLVEVGSTMGAGGASPVP